MKRYLFLILLCLPLFGLTIDTSRKHYEINWSQGEQDSVYFEIDTLISLDSATVIFTVWKSPTNTSRVICDTLSKDTINNIAIDYITTAQTDTFSEGQYPADLWVETKTGRSLQVWYKVLNLIKSSRGQK